MAVSRKNIILIAEAVGQVHLLCREKIEMLRMGNGSNNYKWCINWVWGEKIEWGTLILVYNYKYIPSAWALSFVTKETFKPNPKNKI